jgi:hypothetical protein
MLQQNLSRFSFVYLYSCEQGNFLFMCKDRPLPPVVEIGRVAVKFVFLRRTLFGALRR